jgi:hypothetical protein
MLRVAQCIEYGGTLPRGHARETLIPCRRRPRKRRCAGLLWVLKQSDDAIHAFCSTCQADEFLIYEWEDTIWADGPMESINVAAAGEKQGERAREPRWGDLEVLLERALKIIGSALSTDDVRRVIGESENPSSALKTILSGAKEPIADSAMERLIPVVMDLWNSLPRTEFGGLSPDAVHQADVSSVAYIGRNAPCPCGSGEEYSRCCLASTLH